MKNRLLMIFLILTMSFFVLVSCTKKNDAEPTSSTSESATTNAPNNSNSPQITSSEIKEFFPFVEGVNLEYTYEGESKNLSATVKSSSDNALTISHDKDSKIEFSNEGAKLDGDFILKLPVKKDASWDSSKGKVTVKNTGYVLSSPLGNLNTVQVSIEGGNTYYIAKNLGIVKVETKDNKVLELTNISSPKDSSTGEDNNKGNTQGSGNNSKSVDYKVSKLYYYDVNEDIIVYSSIDSTVNDKNASKFFEDKFKNPPKDTVGHLMPSSTKINSINVDKEKSTVTVDVSEVFTDSMNLGTSSEGGVLQSIANTLGEAYNCKNVVLTANGKEFTTGHSIISPSEPLIVDTSNSKEM